jgi:hypothetical protein
MREFFPDSLVENYEPLVREMENHPKDRHVLAAAVACRRLPGHIQPERFSVPGRG